MAANLFELCGVRFLQSVNTPYGKGVVQGILRQADGALKVIVSHDPATLPAEIVPMPGMWKLMYYEPEEINW